MKKSTYMIAALATATMMGLSPASAQFGMPSIPGAGAVPVPAPVPALPYPLSLPLQEPHAQAWLHPSVPLSLCPFFGSLRPSSPPLLPKGARPIATSKRCPSIAPLVESNQNSAAPKRAADSPPRIPAGCVKVASGGSAPLVRAAAFLCTPAGCAKSIWLGTLLITKPLIKRRLPEFLVPVRLAELTRGPRGTPRPHESVCRYTHNYSVPLRPARDLHSVNAKVYFAPGIFRWNHMESHGPNHPVR